MFYTQTQDKQEGGELNEDELNGNFCGKYSYKRGTRMDDENGNQRRIYLYPQSEQNGTDFIGIKVAQTFNGIISNGEVTHFNPSTKNYFGILYEDADKEDWIL